MFSGLIKILYNINYYFAASQKKRYKILEVGHLPQDLESEDVILEHFF